MLIFAKNLYPIFWIFQDFAILNIVCLQQLLFDLKKKSKVQAHYQQEGSDRIMFLDWRPHLLLPVYVSDDRIQSCYKPYLIDSTCFQEHVLVVTFRFIMLFLPRAHTIVDFSMKIFCLSCLLIKSNRRDANSDSLNCRAIPFHWYSTGTTLFFKLKRHQNLFLKTS